MDSKSILKEKVSIADAVLEFYNQRVKETDPTFTANQLRFFVANILGTKSAPSSADRILRMLRKEGRVNYLMTNRFKSSYIALPLALTPEEPYFSQDAIDRAVVKA